MRKARRQNDACQEPLELLLAFQADLEGMSVGFQECFSQNSLIPRTS